MELDFVLNDLGERAGDGLGQDWDISVDRCADASFDFLTPNVFLEARAWTGLPKTIDPLLEQTAQIILQRPFLRMLAWHTYRLAHQTRENPPWEDWPVLDHALNGAGGIFYLLIGLAGFDRLRKTQRERGISEAMTHAIGSDINIGFARYGRSTGGQPGIERRLLNWCGLIGSGDLHQLGRFQYHFRPFRGQLRAYRHRQTGHVLALSEPDITFDSEGFVAHSDESNESTDVASWTSKLTEDGDRITGFPISPTGRALPGSVALRADAWDCVLGGGDRILGMHIPEGEAMTLDRCRDSMAEALEFFPRYYPDHPFVGFECTSWILNTQLADMLGENSNLVKYQKELYLFPLPSGGKDGLYFIFDREEVDFDSAPRDTTLRRAFLDHLKTGKRLRSGGMFYLKEDLTQFGTKHYQSQFAAARALAAS